MGKLRSSASQTAGFLDERRAYWRLHNGVGVRVRSGRWASSAVSSGGRGRSNKARIIYSSRYSFP